MTWARWLAAFAAHFLTYLALTLMLFTGAHTVREYRNLPIDTDKHVIMHRRDEGLLLLDRHGERWFRFGGPRQRTIVSLADVSPWLIQAVLAAEDQTFYEHPGISLRGITRALIQDYEARAWRYGGSTITQQLAKNVYLTPEKTFGRKYREAIVAWKLEQRFSKDDILEMYLNTAYWGDGVIGAEAAAQSYFDVSARDLSLPQASLLAGMLTAPTRYNPRHNEAGAQGRQAVVLQALREGGAITERQLHESVIQPLALAPRPVGNTLGIHFALTVRNQLIERLGARQTLTRGLMVRTTMDPAIQRQAEEQLAQHVAGLAAAGASNGAAVVLEVPTNQLRALVGSVGWEVGSFGKINMATAPRQTGSAFKPVVYAAGLTERAITPASRLLDAPTTFGTDYRPQNYDGRYRGLVTVRRALSHSLNVPAVQVADAIGPAAIVALAQRLGISSIPLAARDYLSTALGAEGISVLELTSAYSTFARHGVYHEPRLITSLTGRGQLPVAWASRSEPVLEPGVAYLVSAILSDNISRQRVFGTALNLTRPAAVKTGTSQSFRDAWTVGYTPQYAVGVWVGNSDNSPMRNLPGLTGAGPLWKELMELVHRGLPAANFVAPATVVAQRQCDGRPEYFLRDTLRPLRCIRATPQPATTPVLE